MNKIEVLIVDDHQIMLDGIVALLNRSKQFEVIAQTTNPNEALELIKTKNPAILITDISMEGLSGIELCKQVKSIKPDVKVLALSMFNDKETITEMLEAGVDGYILKNTGTEELLNALQKISLGQLFFSNDVTIEMLKTITQPKLVQTEPINLTQREVEIVKLIGDEFNNAQIGEKLFISERTVETHRKNIFRKTNTKSVAGLIKYAIENKIV
ncbi:MAG: response regulator transcription factor [Bacteroidia bacterium]|nr:response regulator transcription factor [Bacteroidia bacterium]MCF8426359.1 response regulator transcription factor [Bacteroidia bacterium]MCF8448102.1 response regulator transcription factor [Bacteroidia bacterium]